MDRAPIHRPTPVLPHTFWCFLNTARSCREPGRHKRGDSCSLKQGRRTAAGDDRGDPARAVGTRRPARPGDQRDRRPYQAVAPQQSRSQRVAEIPGVGVLTATAVVSAMGDPAAFRSGREFAAWLGLVPRHKGTGGRVRLFGISKRGDKYLRTLLFHGARAVLSRAKARSEWAVRLAARRPPTWSPWRWPTRRRAQSGPCWPTTGRIKRTSSASGLGALADGNTTEHRRWPLKGCARYDKV